MTKKNLFLSSLIIATSLTFMACGNTNTASQTTETSSTTQQVTSTTAVTKTTSATKQTTTAQATTKQQSTTKSTETKSKQTTTTAQSKTSATENVAVQSETEPVATEPDTTKSAGGSVWIDDTGKKYHKKSTCSNMDAPYQVSVDEATSRGYTPCKKCYK